MILKCAITDDEPLALDLLESYVKKTPSLELEGRYRNAVEALAGLKENPVDLLFLDIQMPELDGMELSKMIPASTRVVFTTAFGQYAIEGYKVNALDYLLKPVSYQEFMRCVGKAIEWFSIARKAAGSNNAAGTVRDNSGVYVKSEQYFQDKIHRPGPDNAGKREYPDRGHIQGSSAENGREMHDVMKGGTDRKHRESTAVVNVLVWIIILCLPYLAYTSGVRIEKFTDYILLLRRYLIP